jgi:MFS family permease
VPSFFQGFGVAPASTVGLAIINDLFFEHERGQKVGMWTLAIDMGLLVGPLGVSPPSPRLLCRN